MVQSGVKPVDGELKEIKKWGLGLGMSILDQNDRGFAAVTGAKRPKDV